MNLRRLFPAKKRPATAQQQDRTVLRNTPSAIEIPHDEQHVARLQAKYAEYEQRSELNRNKVPEALFDLHCKITILKAVLTEGVANHDTLEKQIADDYCESFYPYKFEDAWEVIADYVETEGVNIRGGTGLPTGV